MKKYELVNVPEGGVKFELSGRRPIILDKNLTDEDAELLLDGGSNKNAAYYIKLKTSAVTENQVTIALK